MLRKKFTTQLELYSPKGYDNFGRYYIINTPLRYVKTTSRSGKISLDYMIQVHNYKVTGYFIYSYWGQVPTGVISQARIKYINQTHSIWDIF